MAIRFLILMSLALLSPQLGSAREVGCSACHVPHYEERGKCGFCHQGIPTTKRKDIAHHRLVKARYAFFRLPEQPVIKQGKQLLSTAGCRRCHVSAQKGNDLAADLDSRTKDLLPDEIYAAMKTPAAFMPDFRFTEEHLVALVNRVLFNSAATAKPETEVPIVIHFDRQEKADKNPFSKYCGGCHKILTAKNGGLGKGDIGPNLSGLLTEFYPQAFKENEPWTPANLEKWLKNPRATRNVSPMAPVPLSAEEFSNLTKVLGSMTPVLPEIKDDIIQKKMEIYAHD